eukprot:gene35799-43840_t
MDVAARNVLVASRPAIGGGIGSPGDPASYKLATTHKACGGGDPARTISPPWSPPEAMRAQVSGPGAKAASRHDVWAFGCLLYEALAGTPFGHEKAVAGGGTPQPPPAALVRCECWRAEDRPPMGDLIHVLRDLVREIDRDREREALPSPRRRSRSPRGRSPARQTPPTAALPPQPGPTPQTGWADRPRPRKAMGRGRGGRN